MVESRKKTFVTSKNLVPVGEICNNIADGMDIDTMTRKYGITTMEVYDAVDFYSANTEMPTKDTSLVLENIPGADADEINLEISSIHETVFLKCLSISREYYPEIEDFPAALYNGIRIVAIENLLNKIKNRAFSSALHMQIQKALDQVISYKDMSDQDLLEDLNADEYLRRKNII